MLDNFSTLLLDMNDTFMFGADCFGDGEDYYVIYRQLGGMMESNRVNDLIQKAYNYLDIRYRDPLYRESFPSLQKALVDVAGCETLQQEELDLLIETFAYHELGYIPHEYSNAITQLAKDFRLGLVIDIWSPKTLWIKALNQAKILPLCGAVSFSSDCGIVKPSPLPFLSVLEQMRVNPCDAVVIGDSIRRDLGGALAAGIQCILVGGSTYPSAFACISNILELVIVN